MLPDVKYNVDVEANFLIRVTDKLECQLETINNGDKEFKFSEALHAYFNVGNRDDIIIKGLKGYQYRSSLDSKIYDLDNEVGMSIYFDDNKVITIRDDIGKRYWN